MPPLTDDQIDSVAIVSRVCAALGIFGGCIPLCIDYYLYPKHRSAANRLVYSLNIAYLISGSAYFISRWGPANRVLCEIQGFLINTSNMAGYLTALLIGVNIALVFFHKGVKSPGQLSPISTYQISAAWTISTLVSIPFVWISDSFGLDSYRDTAQWCWFVDDRFRMGVMYYPLWIVMFVVFVVCGLAQTVLWRRQEQITSDLDRGVSMGPLARTFAAMRSQTNAALALYVQKLVLHLMVFFITWIPPTINRMHNMADKENPIMVLFVLQSIFATSRGFWNGLVYFYTTTRLGFSEGSSKSETNSHRSGSIQYTSKKGATAPQRDASIVASASFGAGGRSPSVAKPIVPIRSPSENAAKVKDTSGAGVWLG
ncbi:hypothetical protein M427DRAFT_168124 [Gonapodya prolifera JEL478]|uniref:G-protein coupled receptors family 2 profile 2 domain-containing protein n=1 Tax=Gonapodya prolifera (strain JEL478) TaxID=1344416 RepID=A0A139AZX0_GONPJ|nr:hypothetical protein M427DRAFT_168124 [Gonapodya prolifera JEL478]|eukprot:KXS22257.1 hypothetical protein M427DRAFT_168124 [Gonapodya prolifera JEL478]